MSTLDHDSDLAVRPRSKIVKIYPIPCHDPKKPQFWDDIEVNEYDSIVNKHSISVRPDSYHSGLPSDVDYLEHLPRLESGNKSNISAALLLNNNGNTGEPPTKKMHSRNIYISYSHLRENTPDMNDILMKQNQVRRSKLNRSINLSIKIFLDNSNLMNLGVNNSR